MRPALRYHGGKWRLAPWIIGHLPAHRVYVEPFGGGASVLLRKERSYAEVYNDLDLEIVNFFEVLRDRSEEFLRLIRLTPFARDELSKAYDIRYYSPGSVLEKARHTLIKSFMGFGSDGIKKPSGFRAYSGNNRRRPPAQDWKDWPDAAQALVGRMQGVIIENRPALDVIKRHDGPETLHYVDPPYVHSTRESDKRYRFEMTDDEHEELAVALHAVKGAVVVSGYACKLYDRLYAGWRVERTIAMADGAKRRIEKLWIKP